jgi:hypothetical protein
MDLRVVSSYRPQDAGLDLWGNNTTQWWEAEFMQFLFWKASNWSGQLVSFHVDCKLRCLCHVNGSMCGVTNRFSSVFDPWNKKGFRNSISLVTYRCFRYQDCIVSHGIWMMMNWKLFRSGCGLIEVLSRNFPGGTEANHEELQSGWPVLRLRVEPSTPRIQVTALNLKFFFIAPVYYFEICFPVVTVSVLGRKGYIKLCMLKYRVIILFRECCFF